MVQNINFFCRYIIKPFITLLINEIITILWEFETREKSFEISQFYSSLPQFTYISLKNTVLINNLSGKFAPKIYEDKIFINKKFPSHFKIYSPLKKFRRKKVHVLSRHILVMRSITTVQMYYLKIRYTNKNYYNK